MTTAGCPTASSSRSPRAAIQIEEALRKLFKDAGKASGSKKGALTKHVNKVVEALLSGTELEGEDAEIVAGIDDQRRP